VNTLTTQSAPDVPGKYQRPSEWQCFPTTFYLQDPNDQGGSTTRINV